MHSSQWKNTGRSGRGARNDGRVFYRIWYLRLNILFLRQVSNFSRLAVALPGRWYGISFTRYIHFQGSKDSATRLCRAIFSPRAEGGAGLPETILLLRFGLRPGFRRMHLANISDGNLSVTNFGELLTIPAGIFLIRGRHGARSHRDFNRGQVF